MLLILILSGCGGGGGKTTPKSSFAPGTCSVGPTSVTVATFDENPRKATPALAFTTSLDSSMTQTNLLSGLSGNCLLQSARYSITSDTFYPSNVALANSSSVVYSPSSPEFRQLNSFFHATQLRDLVTDTLGFPLSGRISIDAHCNVSDNAYFSPGSSRICLGYHSLGGGKQVWAADDADVIIHEAGHSVNHALASTSILNSTEEAGAIDESIADYWAFTIADDAQLSEWFLGSIGASYVRDATLNYSYPSSMSYQIHSDSRVLTEVLYDLRDASNLGKDKTDRLVKLALQALPATARFADFYDAFYAASGPGAPFLNLTAPERALIVSKFTTQGIHRADSATGLRLSTLNSQVLVIDDHSYSFQASGNCNGQLDVGETALVLVNLENVNGTAMGVGVATLGAAPSGITVASGGGVGEFFRLNASNDFIGSLPAGSSNRKDAVAYAAFLVRATSSGAKNFSLSFKPMYADPTGTLPVNPDVSVNFSLTVGSTATSSSCTNAGLWP